MSEASRTSNNFWKQYQIKAQDNSITPATVLFNSLSHTSNGSQNYLHDIGTDTLKLSAAYPKIRNNTKVYNTHLLSTPSSSMVKSFEVAQLFEKPVDIFSTSDYGLERKSNLVSSNAYVSGTNSNLKSTFLKKFLAVDSSLDNVLGDNQPFLANYDETVNTHSFRRNFEARTLPTVDSQEAIPTLSDGEDRILSTEQTVLQQKLINPYESNDLIASSNLENSVSFFSNELTSKTNFKGYTNSLIPNSMITPLSSRVFSLIPFGPVLSTNPTRSLNYQSVFDGTEHLTTVHETSLGTKIEKSLTPNTTIEPAIGSLEKIPKQLLTLY